MSKLLNRGLPGSHNGGHFRGGGKGIPDWWKSIPWFGHQGASPPKGPGGGSWLPGIHPGGNTGNGGHSNGHHGGGSNGDSSKPDSGGSAGSSSGGHGGAVNVKPYNDQPTTGSSSHHPTTYSDSDDGSTAAQPGASQSSLSAGAQSSTLSSSPLHTASSLPAAPTGSVHGVNITAIVIPIVILSLFGCAFLAFFLRRRRRLYSERHGTQLTADVEDRDDASLAPTKSTRTPFAFRGMILPPRSAIGRAALRPHRGRAASPLAGMAEQEGSRPISMVSSVFDFQNPFTGRAAVSDSTVNHANSSVGAQLSHEDAEAYEPSAMLRPGASHSNHGYGASVSGSIVGSGMFSLASANHGHSSTPGLDEESDPFADVPPRPYSTGAWTDYDGALRSSWTSSQIALQRTSSGGSADVFMPGVDEPPIPHHEVLLGEARPIDVEDQLYDQQQPGPSQRDASPTPVGLSAHTQGSLSAPSSTGAVAHYDGSSAEI